MPRPTPLGSNSFRVQGVCDCPKAGPVVAEGKCPPHDNGFCHVFNGISIATDATSLVPEGVGPHRLPPCSRLCRTTVPESLGDEAALQFAEDPDDLA
jgi:hypothetical protein